MQLEINRCAFVAVVLCFVYFGLSEFLQTFRGIFKAAED